VEAKRGSCGLAPFMFNLSSRYVSGTHHALGAALPGKRPPVIIKHEAGWAPVLVWICMEKISSPHQHSNPLTIQPIASRYTDCVVLAPLLNGTLLVYKKVLTFMK
jgi:hypothetical protein